MRYGFRIREEGQPILFSSNKEVLYPKIQSIAEKQRVVKGDYQRYSTVIVKLLNILEELEKLLSEKRIKHKYILVNGEDIDKGDYFILVALKVIWRYCEPLNGESTLIIYNELEKIEGWLCG